MNRPAAVADRHVAAGATEGPDRPARSPRSGRRRRPARAGPQPPAVRPMAPANPPATPTCGEPVEHLARRQLAVAAGSEQRPQHGHAALREQVGRGQQHGVAQRAAEPRLVAVRPARRHRRRGRRSGSQPITLGGRLEPVGDLGGPARDVDEHGLHAEQPGDPRLRERDAAARGSRSRRSLQGTPGAISIAFSISSVRRGPGLRIDHDALPRDAADDRARAVEQAAMLGDRKRADDVAAAADADHQRTL